MDSDPNELIRDADDMFLEFGRACRAERDRVQVARLEAEDRRFDNPSNRAVAELFVGRLIATLGRR